MAVLKSEMTLDDSKFKDGIEDAKKATKGLEGALDDLSKQTQKAAQDTAKLKREMKNAQDHVAGFERNVNNLKGSLGSMISSLSSGDILGFAGNIKNATLSVKSLVPALTGATGVVGGTTAAVTGLGAAIQMALGPVGLAVAAIGAITAISVKAIKTTEEFNKNLKDFSALTGMVGKDLKDVGDMAKEMGLKFGTSANNIVQSMQLIGSQAPELLKDKDALGAVTEAAIVLAKAAGIEVTDAAKGLTTVMNQMNVSATEASNIINALAAGSQNGAGDVAYLQTAIEKSGTIAAECGLSYQQLIGTIETLAPKFSSADVAGSSLKGVLTTLSTKVTDDFNPSIVGLSKALENLDKANLSAADKVKLFGAANVTAATILINNREALDQMTNSVTGTTTAYDQMEAKSGQLAGAWDTLKVACENLFTTIGNSYAMKALGAIIYGVVVAIKYLVEWIEFTIKCWTKFYDIVFGLIKKLYENVIKPIFTAIGQTISNSAIFKKAKELWVGLVKVVTNVVKKIKEIWNKFMEWLGLNTKEISVDANVKINTDTSEVDKVAGGLDGVMLGSGSGSNGKSSKVTKEEEIIIKGSLKDIQKQISELNKQLINTTNLDEIDAIKKKLEDLKKEEYIAKIQLGIDTGKIDIDKEIEYITDSAKSIDIELEDLEEKVKVTTDDKELLELNKKIKELKDKREIITCKVNDKESLEELISLQNQIEDLEQNISVVTETTQIDSLKEELKGLKDKEIVIRTKVIENQVFSYDLDTLEGIQKKKSELESKRITIKLDSDGAEEEIKNLNNQIEELSQKETEFKIKLGIDVDKTLVEGTLPYIQKQISDLQAERLTLKPGIDKARIDEINAELSKLVDEERIIKIELGIDKAEAQRTFSDMAKEINGGIKSAYELGDSIASIGDKFNDLANKQDASIWEWVSAGVDTITSLITTLGTVADAMEQLGLVTQTTSAIQSAASKQAQADNVAEATTEQALTSAESGEAIAGATKSGAKLPFPFNIAAIAAGIAAVVSALAMISRFQDGGIVPKAQNGMICSGSYCGDKNLVRVNGGEMILNGMQQANLFRMLNNGGVSTGNSLNGKVSFEISGKSLKGVLDNYNSKISKVK